MGVKACPHCAGTGWWSRAQKIGRDGYQMAGGPCNRCTNGLIFIPDRKPA